MELTWEQVDDFDYVNMRLNGFYMLERYRSKERWEQARLISFITASSMGATKKKTAEDFMPMNDKPKAARIDEQTMKKLMEL